MAKRKRLHPIFKIIILLIIICAVITVDSRYRLTVSEYEVSSALLPAEFDGYKIVQLSDLHGMEFGEGNSRLVEMVAAQSPDIIAITGDMVDSETDMEVIDSLLCRLTEVAPVYFVSGNHEWASGRLEELAELFDRYSVTYLKNEYVMLTSGDSAIVLAGVEDPNGWRDMSKPDELVDIIKKYEGEKFTVLLGHRNYWVEEYPSLRVDIILCGHAHGGIVRLPLLGGVLGAGYELFPEHIDGITECGRYSMIVSRGLGSSLKIPRFLNNPEIVVVTLKTK